MCSSSTCVATQSVIVCQPFWIYILSPSSEKQPTRMFDVANELYLKPQPPWDLWLMVPFRHSLLYLEACAQHHQSFFFKVLILWIRKLNCTSSTTPHPPTVSCLFCFIICYHLFCFICWLREHGLDNFAPLCIILKLLFCGRLEKLRCTRVTPAPRTPQPALPENTTSCYWWQVRKRLVL